MDRKTLDADFNRVCDILTSGDMDKTLKFLRKGYLCDKCMDLQFIPVPYKGDDGVTHYNEEPCPLCTKEEDQR